MLKVVDVVYHCHHEYDQPQQVLAKHSRSLGFVDHIKDRVQYEVISHLNYEGKEKINGVQYAFFKRGNEPWQIPFKTHRYIRSVKPDVVLVHGFIFPLQVIALKLVVGKKCRIILHHHADQPAPSVRRVFQKIADRFVAAYLFTSRELAKPWLEQKVIRNKDKCVEVLGASTLMQAKDKQVSKSKLGVSGSINILWVGRLNANKDPMTVLKGFQQFVLQEPAAMLFMIYQTEELLEQLQQEINKDHLQNNVRLVGKLPEEELADWYSAADIFISGSHSEGSGYALVEAMHCGCIPVVTDIPSFNKITAAGKYGFLYPAGNGDALGVLLKGIRTMSLDELSAKTITYAKSHLGFKNIADELFECCTKLVSVKR